MIFSRSCSVRILLQEKTTAFGGGPPACSLVGIQASPESFLAVTHDHRGCPPRLSITQAANKMQLKA